MLRRIRDKQLYLPSGWPSWQAFCAYFSPEEPERIDILIRALEVLESRGEKRDFGEAEADAAVGAGDGYHFVVESYLPVCVRGGLG